MRCYSGAVHIEAKEAKEWNYSLAIQLVISRFINTNKEIKGHRKGLASLSRLVELGVRTGSTDGRMDGQSVLVSYVESYEIEST